MRSPMLWVLVVALGAPAASLYTLNRWGAPGEAAIVRLTPPYGATPRGSGTAVRAAAPAVPRAGTVAGPPARPVLPSGSAAVVPAPAPAPAGPPPAVAPAPAAATPAEAPEVPDPDASAAAEAPAEPAGPAPRWQVGQPVAGLVLQPVSGGAVSLEQLNAGGKGLILSFETNPENTPVLTTESRSMKRFLDAFGDRVAVYYVRHDSAAFRANQTMRQTFGRLFGGAQQSRIGLVPWNPALAEGFGVADGGTASVQVLIDAQGVLRGVFEQPADAAGKRSIPNLAAEYLALKR